MHILLCRLPLLLARVGLPSLLLRWVLPCRPSTQQFSCSHCCCQAAQTAIPCTSDWLQAPLLHCCWDELFVRHWTNVEAWLLQSACLVASSWPAPPWQRPASPWGGRPCTPPAPCCSQLHCPSPSRYPHPACTCFSAKGMLTSHLTM